MEALLSGKMENSKRKKKGYKLSFYYFLIRLETIFKT